VSYSPQISTSPTGLAKLTIVSSISIVFIHGLVGDREQTWSTADADGPWPQTLLPRKLPHARVLTFGYDANVMDWRDVVSMNRIGNHSKNLLADLAGRRDIDDTVRGC
jgi:protein SERAC1